MQYMSPEHLGVGEIGPQSDVFSLGALLTFAATGKAPFDADLQSAVIGRILTQPPDLGDLGGPLRDTISACLAKNPADRPGLDVLLARFAAPATAPAAPSVSSHDQPTAFGEQTPHTSTVTLGPSPAERRANGADPGQELHPGVDGSRRGSGPGSLIATLTRPAADGRSRAFRALAFSPHGAILAASLMAASYSYGGHWTGRPCAPSPTARTFCAAMLCTAWRSARTGASGHRGAARRGCPLGRPDGQATAGLQRSRLRLLSPSP